MRRADRLFQIVQLLVRHRRLTAKALADRLEVSERTIYRDVADLSQVRRALRERRKLRFEYRDGEERLTRRTVRPLGLAFFGAVWVLTAWCELRDGFRNFRPDRIAWLELLDERFEPEPGRSFEDYLRCMNAAG